MIKKFEMNLYIKENYLLQIYNTTSKRETL